MLSNLLWNFSINVKERLLLTNTNQIKNGRKTINKHDAQLDNSYKTEPPLKTALPVIFRGAVNTCSYFYVWLKAAQVLLSTVYSLTPAVMMSAIKLETLERKGIFGYFPKKVFPAELRCSIEIRN